MSSKIRKDLTLYPESYEYAEQIKRERGLGSVSAAIDMIIAEHKERESGQADIISDKIIDKLEEKYKNMFTRMRLGISTADVNSQVLLEIMNSVILNTDMDRMYDTEILESDIVKESREIVKNRIARYKQIKDNKAKNK